MRLLSAGHDATRPFRTWLSVPALTPTVGARSRCVWPRLESSTLTGWTMGTPHHLSTGSKAGLLGEGFVAPSQMPTVDLGERPLPG